jgi:hypothetical protein
MLSDDRVIIGLTICKRVNFSASLPKIQNIKDLVRDFGYLEAHGTDT